MKDGKLISQGRGETWREEDEKESKRKEKMRTPRRKGME